MSMSISPTVEEHWAKLKDLSDDMKLELIMLLACTMRKQNTRLDEITPLDATLERMSGNWDEASGAEIVDSWRKHP